MGTRGAEQLIVEPQPPTEGDRLRVAAMLATDPGVQACALGGLVAGGVVGVIAAWNIAIYLGVERGYEASLVDVFAESVPVGILVVLVLVAGPVLGVIVVMRRFGRPPSDSAESDQARRAGTR